MKPALLLTLCLAWPLAGCASAPTSPPPSAAAPCDCGERGWDQAPPPPQALDATTIQARRDQEAARRKEQAPAPP